MVDPNSNLPKYKIKKTPRPAEAPRPAAPPVEDAKPLTIAGGPSFTPQDKQGNSISSDSILEDAYGETDRRHAALRRWQSSKRGLIALFIFGLASLATLFYAHYFNDWPRLSRITWYLPFILCTALAVWLVYFSISLWKGADRLLTLFGFVLVGSMTYGNVIFLESACKSQFEKPSNGLWAPSNVYNLYMNSEFNTLRGIPRTLEAYTAMSVAQHRRAFHDIPTEDWRPLFERYLTAEEMRRVNVVSLQSQMHLVVDRIREQRRNTFIALQNEIETPSIRFHGLRVAVKPYSWIIQTFQ